MMIPSNHVSYLAEERLKQLIAPLDKVGGVHYFCYGVNYPDTSGFTLHTSSKFYETWFKNEFPMCGFHLQSGWHFWEDVINPEQLKIAEELDIGNGIIHIAHTAEKTEILAFGCRSLDQNGRHFIVNNLSHLKKFKQYFIEKSADLLFEAEKQRIIPTSNMVKPGIITREDNATLEFLKSIDLISKKLSAREYECFCLLVKGATITEISQNLNLAKQTVGVYISRVKNKLNCTNRKSLLKKAEEYGLLDFNF